MTGTAVMMGVMILLAKVCGLLRDMLITASYGTGSTAAIAYETASKLPVTLFDLVIGGVVTAAFVPVFNELLVQKGRDQAHWRLRSRTRGSSSSSPPYWHSLGSRLPRRWSVGWHRGWIPPRTHSPQS